METVATVIVIVVAVLVIGSLVIACIPERPTVFDAVSDNVDSQPTPIFGIYDWNN